MDGDAGEQTYRDRNGCNDHVQTKHSMHFIEKWENVTLGITRSRTSSDV